MQTLPSWIDCWRVAHGIRPTTGESLAAGLKSLIEKGSPRIPVSGASSDPLALFAAALAVELELLAAEIDVQTSDVFNRAVLRLIDVPV